MEPFPSVQFQEEYLCFVADIFFFPGDYITIGFLCSLRDSAVLKCLPQDAL